MTKRPPKQIQGQGRNSNSSKASLSDEALWQAFTSKITPLSEANRHVTSRSSKDASAKARPHPCGPAPRVRHDPPAHVFTPSSPAPAPFEHGKAAGLDRQSQRKMRRGKVEIEARLDLHGMIQTEAHRNLVGFLERAYLSGKRSVLVVTGKGLKRTGEIGVLRQAVPRWLNEAPMKNWIRGFDYAAPADGGEGALYILLRRKR